MTYNRTAVFVETTYFTNWANSYLDEEAYRELQNYLLANPESGAVIQRSGGIRKLRWARQGMGKSGGARIIYYWAKTREQIYLLTAYNKNEKENIEAAVLAKIAKQLGEIK